MGRGKPFPGHVIPTAPELPAEASQGPKDQDPSSRKEARGAWMMCEARALDSEFSTQLVGEVARHVVHTSNPRTQKAEAKGLPRGSSYNPRLTTPPGAGCKFRYRG